MDISDSTIAGTSKHNTRLVCTHLNALFMPNSIIEHSKKTTLFEKIRQFSPVVCMCAKRVNRKMTQCQYFFFLEQMHPFYVKI